MAVYLVSSRKRVTLQMLNVLEMLHIILRLNAGALSLPGH